MKNRVPEVFLSEMFGELRIMEDDNKFYFCAADVCSALGYSNPSRELIYIAAMMASRLAERM